MTGCASPACTVHWNAHHRQTLSLRLPRGHQLASWISGTLSSDSATVPWSTNINPGQTLTVPSGLGGTPAMGHPNPLDFTTQVTNDHCLYAKRTGCRSLLVLLSPWRSISVVLGCAKMLLKLLLAGDIETNPGPRNEHCVVSSDMLDILKTLQSGQSAMLAQLGSIRSTLDEHEKRSMTCARD